MARSATARRMVQPLDRMTADRHCPLGFVRACVGAGDSRSLGVLRTDSKSVNVAMGGTLYPEIQELAGTRNEHRMPPIGHDAQQKFDACASRCDYYPKGGVVHELSGCAKGAHQTRLHGQGSKAAGPRVNHRRLREGLARQRRLYQGRPRFTLAVQWHPELGRGDDLR